MTRRHFMSHLAGAAVLAAPAISFTNSILANAAELKKQHKSCIMLWMSGGPSTIDMWDLKPGAATGGQFKPISTSVDGLQICEHMPLMAKQMNQPGDRSLDEHARGRPQPRPLLHAHRLRAQSEHRASQLRRGRSRTNWPTKCPIWKFRRSCRSAAAASARASWA